jgi:hypothetical protein
VQREKRHGLLTRKSATDVRFIPFVCPRAPLKRAQSAISFVLWQRRLLEKPSEEITEHALHRAGRVD